MPGATRDHNGKKRSVSPDPHGRKVGSRTAYNIHLLNNATFHQSVPIVIRPFDNQLPKRYLNRKRTKQPIDLTNDDSDVDSLSPTETTPSTKKTRTATRTDKPYEKPPPSAAAIRRVKKISKQPPQQPTDMDAMPLESTTSRQASFTVKTRRTNTNQSAETRLPETPIDTLVEPASKPVSALEARRAKKARVAVETATPLSSLTKTPPPNRPTHSSSLEVRRAQRAAAEEDEDDDDDDDNDDNDEDDDNEEDNEDGEEDDGDDEDEDENDSFKTATPSPPPKAPVQSTKPMSALEARRAKKLNATTTEPEPEYQSTITTIGPDRLPTRIYSSPSPQPSSQPAVFSDIEKDDVDKDEVNNDDEFGTPMELSDEDVDTGKETPVTQKTDQGPDKNRLKDLNKLLDPTSVSTYSSENVISFKHEGETCYCIGFEKNQQLVFIGHALIGSLVGSIDIYGATISSHLASQQLPNDQHTMSFSPVFSPRTSPLMVVRSIPYEISSSAKSSTTLDSTLSDLGSILEPLKSRWDTFESVVVVKNLEWCGADQLETILPTFRNLFRLGNNDAYELNDGPIYRDINGFQPIVRMTPEVRALKIDPSWNQGINNVLEYEQDHSVPSVSMICGTKNAGKSSFARYMVNRLMKSHQRVAYLETDVGQTEFTPSGLVSLHIVDTPLLGPPFTHPNLKCKRSFYIGSTTPKNDPTYYQDCIRELVRLYREEAVQWMSCPEENQFYQSLPLVVNTHGWVKGLGYELLFSLMDDVAPTHVFGFGCTLNASPGYSLPPDFADRTLSTEQDRRLIQLGTPMASFNQEQLLELSTRLSRYQHYRQQPTTLSDKYKAAELRQLMFISYMYHDAHIFGTKTEEQRAWWQTNLRLVDRIPWTIDWRHDLKGIWILFDDVPSSQLLYALNGSLVGLVGATDENTTAIEKVTTTTTNETIPPKYFSPMTTAPPNPSITTCYGVGIIRSIDAEQHKIHLLTPLPFEQLRQVTRLVKGDIDLPISCLFDQQGGTGNYICGIPGRLVPYVSQDVVNSIGSGTAIVRRNIMRRSQQN